MGSIKAALMAITLLTLCLLATNTSEGIYNAALYLSLHLSAFLLTTLDGYLMPHVLFFSNQTVLSVSQRIRCAVPVT